MNKRNIFKTLAAVMLGGIMLGSTSCQKMILDPMSSLFIESQGLCDTSADSVKHFTSKFNTYVERYPESKNDKLYYPIVENIGEACATFGIQNQEVGLSIIIYFDPEWDGIDEITF